MTASPRASVYFEIFQRRRQELLALAREMLGIVNELEIEQTKSDGPQSGKLIQGLIERLEEQQLRALVIGRFNAGKSTFVNALFGQVVLPASLAPTTGVLCQIRYADEQHKRAVLHPKPGMGKDGRDAPFEVRIGNLQEELGRYVKIDHFGDSEATSRYSKLELHWPLELCRQGVEFTDSVGLDDPDSRDAITLDFAGSADVILYCMKSQDAYSAKDKQVLTLLKSLGHESILFIITNYDNVRESAASGETTEEEFKRFLHRQLMPWTELGATGIQYVDSKSALVGRMKGDRDLIDRSGMVEVEESMSAFLAEEKGRAKLMTSLRPLRSVSRGLRNVMPSQIAMWQTSTAELEKRYRAAEAPLRLLETTRQAMLSSVESDIKDVGRDSRDMAEVFFRELPDKIRKWAKEHELEGSLGFPPRKSTIQPLVEEMVHHLKEKIAEETAQWNLEVLSPMIKSNVTAIQDKLEGKAREFIRNIDHLRIQIAVGEDLDDSEIAGAKEPSFLSRLIGFGYTLATGDIVTGGIGMVVGPKAMLNTIVLQVIAGVLLAVFGLLNPVAIIAAAIAAILGGNFVNILQLRNAIQTTVGEAVATEMEKRRSELAKSVQDTVQKQLMELRDALDAGLGNEIDSLRAEVETMLEKHRAGQADAEREIEKIHRLEAANLVIDEKLDMLFEEAKAARI